MLYSCGRDKHQEPNKCGIFLENSSLFTSNDPKFMDISNWMQKKQKELNRLKDRTKEQMMILSTHWLATELFLVNLRINLIRIAHPTVFKPMNSTYVIFIHCYSDELGVRKLCYAQFGIYFFILW